MKNFILLIFLFISFSNYAQELVSNAYPLESSTSTKRFNTLNWTVVDSFSIYGGGTLLGLITNDEDTENTTSPSGSLGINFATEGIICNLFFSYNGKKTIDMNSLAILGTSLLNPNTGGESFSITATAFLNKYFRLRADLILADNIWQIDPITSINVSPMLARFGLTYIPFDFSKLKNNNLRFNLEFLLTRRDLLGDIRNINPVIDGKELRQKAFSGFDLTANIYLNSVQMFVRLSQNYTDDFDIPGFTGSQVTFGVNATGKLITLK